MLLERRLSGQERLHSGASLQLEMFFLSCRVFDNDTTIRLVSDSKCVDISDYSTDDGANIW